MPNKLYKVDAPIEKACFPADALVTLLDASTGAPLRKARMDELRVGDTVRCLKPAARRGPGLFRDDEQTYVAGACRVFNYPDVDPDEIGREGSEKSERELEPGGGRRSRSSKRAWALEGGREIALTERGQEEMEVDEEGRVFNYHDVDIQYPVSSGPGEGMD